MTDHSGIRQRAIVKNDSDYNWDDVISGVMFAVLIGIVWLGLSLMAV